MLISDHCSTDFDSDKGCQPIRLAAFGVIGFAIQ
jgi:hypothetical protein